ncbi:acylphosphatase [Streptomyces noursei]|uniref:acylphosphatase n=1 Tax=Streptomyces noursei TaxID=1971 RepID=UPI003BF5DDDC
MVRKHVIVSGRVQGVFFRDTCRRNAVAQGVTGWVRKHVIVSGRVQGVFFRDTCRRNAVAQGVTGWVRNLPGGDVEAVFEGPEDRVTRMVDWAHQGPPAAAVTEVEVRDEEPERLSGFEVLPTPRV